MFVNKVLGGILNCRLNLVLLVDIFLSFIKVTDTGELKKLGSATLIYYFVTSALACALGLIVANIFLSGDVSTPAAYQAYQAEIKPLQFNQFIGSFFSKNIFASFVESNILQIVVFSCFLGI